MSFRLVPKSVTLNDLERRNCRYFALFQRFAYLPGVLRKSSRSLSHLLMSSCFNMEPRLKFNSFGVVVILQCDTKSVPVNFVSARSLI